MSKKLVILALATAFAMSTASFSFAAKIKCTVDSVEGDKVNMTCEKADKVSAGDEVKVSLPRGKAGIEGC